MFTGIETINPQLRKSAARRRSRPRQQPELDPTMPKLTQSPAWQALAAHYQALKQAHMRDLFMPDPARFDKFSLGAAGLSLDYSKNRVRGNVLAADRFGPPSRRGGQGGMPCSPQRKINAIEKRAVLHVALRNRSDRPILHRRRGRYAVDQRGARSPARQLFCPDRGLDERQNSD